MRVFSIPAGATLRVSCRGKGCRGKATYTRRFSKARSRFDITKRVKRDRLRKGAVLELRVTRPGMIGRVFRIKALADGNATDSDRCPDPAPRRRSAAAPDLRRPMTPKHALAVGAVAVVAFAAGFAGARASGEDQKPATARAPSRAGLPAVATPASKVKVTVLGDAAPLPKTRRGAR